MMYRQLCAILKSPSIEDESNRRRAREKLEDSLVIRNEINRILRYKTENSKGTHSESGTCDDKSACLMCIAGGIELSIAVERHSSGVDSPCDEYGLCRVIGCSSTVLLPSSSANRESSWAIRSSSSSVRVLL